MLAECVLPVVAIVLPGGEAPPVAEPQPEAWSPHALVEVIAIDAATGGTIDEFFAEAGTDPNKIRGWNWQDHTRQPSASGVVRWPTGEGPGYDVQAVRIEAPGYKPALTPAIARSTADARLLNRLPDGTLIVTPGKPRRIRLLLARDPGLIVQVVAPSSEPAAGARLGVATRNHPVALRAGWPNRPTHVADEQGWVTLEAHLSTAQVALSHADGFLALRWDDFAAKKVVRLEPWGEVRCRVDWGGLSSSGQQFRLTARTSLTSDLINMRVSARTNDRGEFVFRRVPPGLVHLRRIDSRVGGYPSQNVTVLAREPTDVCIGGGGRSVVGRITGVVDPSLLTVTAIIDPPSWRWAEGVAAHDRFLASPVGKLYAHRGVAVDRRGRFRIDRVKPASYELRFYRSGPNGRGAPVAGGRFRVDSIDGGASDEPLDAGEFPRWHR